VNDIQQETAETEAQIDDRGLFEPSPSTDWRETYAALEVDQEGHR
jgi:hypothetical protein